MPLVTTPVPNLLGTSSTLLVPPTKPGYRSIDWKMNTPSSANTSPYTGQQQILSWPGAEYFSCTVTLPMMRPREAAQWQMFLLSCAGKLNAFQLYDPLWINPSGNVQRSIPACAAPSATVNVVGTNALSTTGWNPSTRGVMNVGDYLQINYRLYRVMSLASSDANGNAVINVWPTLREAPGAGTDLYLVQACGIFRLVSDSVAWTTDYDRLTAVSFAATEFR